MLPTSINTTYTPNTPVLSADLNDIQACIVGPKHPLLTRRIPATAGVPISSSGAPAAGSYSAAVVGPWKATGAAQVLYVPLEVYTFQRIVNVRANVSCGTTDVIQMELWRMTMSPGGGPGQHQLGSTQTSAGHGTPIETLSISGVNELPSSVNANYFVTLTASSFANAPTVYGLELDLDAL